MVSKPGDDNAAGTPKYNDLAMNAFNRAYTLVSLIVLLIVGVFALIAPGAFIGLIQGAADGLHRVLFGGMGDAPVLRLVIRVVIAAIFAAVILVALYLEIQRPGARTIEVARQQGSRIRVMNETVERKVQNQIEGLGEITQAKVRVSEKGKAVVASVEVFTTRDADAIAKGADVAKVVTIVIQDQMGLTLAGKPDVVVKQTNAKTGKPQTTTLLSSSGEPASPEPAGLQPVATESAPSEPS